jgi:hypothetical protein
MFFRFIICFLFLYFFSIFNNKKLKNINEIKKYMIKKYHLNNINKLKTFNQKLQWNKIFNIKNIIS